MDFLEFKKWYDGYSFGSEKSIYNPFSVMKAIDRKKCAPTFKSDDDVLTLLIHLGYLSYDADTSLVKIPNAEVQSEFTSILKKAKNRKLVELVKSSEQLLNDTLAGNEEAVAAAIQKVRDLNYAPMYYNDEQALRYAVKLAYIVCEDRYTKIEELPSGRGIADVVYLPDQGERLPALQIELKDTERFNLIVFAIKAQHFHDRA